MVPNLGASSGVHQQGNIGESRPGSVAGASNTNTEMETGEGNTKGTEQKTTTSGSEVRVQSAVSDYRHHYSSEVASTTYITQAVAPNQSAFEQRDACFVAFKAGRMEGYINGVFERNELVFMEKYNEGLKEAFGIAYDLGLLQGHEEMDQSERSEAPEASGSAERTAPSEIFRTRNLYASDSVRKKYDQGLLTGYELGLLEGSTKARHLGYRQGLLDGEREGRKAGFISGRGSIQKPKEEQ